MSDSEDTSAVEIRPATTDHVDRLLELWSELATDQREHESHILVAENRTSMRESLVRSVVSDNALVAVCEGTIVGFVLFHVEYGDLELDVSRGFVDNLYVVPDYRGREIGAALLEAAESTLEESGVDVVALEVLTSNDLAREFYDRQGYEPHRLELQKSLDG